jgi:phosphoglycolate phosphatase-like HAD superfamily hydrolase
MLADVRAIVLGLEVLVDEEGAVREYVTSVLGRPVPSDAPRPTPEAWLAEFRGRLDGNPARPYAERLAEAYDAAMRRFALEIFADDAPGLIRAVALAPVAPEATRTLRRLAKRFRLALVTVLDAELLAEPLGRLQAPFSSVVSGDDARDGDPLRLALARLGLPPPSVLYAGHRQAEAAQRMGVRTALIGNSSGTADLVVPTLAALAQALGL